LRHAEQKITFKIFEEYPEYRPDGKKEFDAEF
jgi:hypothetical protein